MRKLTRRQFAVQGTLVSAAMLAGTSLSGREKKRDSRITLGFSSYALPTKTPLEAISSIAETGYDSIELCVFPPRESTLKTHREIGDRLAATGLKLTSLMENLKPLETEAEFQASTERLKRVCEFARKFTPNVPLIQTVLGGKDWPQQKSQCRDRVGEWKEIANEANVVLAIKPHRGHAMSRPQDAIWLIEQLGNSPWIRMCFDYSHFIFRGMPMRATIEESLPYTAHIAVKDAVEIDGRVVFQSPGQAGTIDYVSLLSQFAAGGYRGDVCVEVSSQIWKQPGYDSSATLNSCYRVLAEAFDSANIERDQ